MAFLYLFSNTRCMKRFFAQNYTESFLPHAKHLGEFLEFVLRVENKRRIPRVLRYYYLYEAISQTHTQKLGEFAKNFTQFLRNSGFFFRFYDELCAGCVRIETLKQQDIYAFYDEHLGILESIFRTYEALLEQQHFFDHYFLQEYEITFELLEEFSAILVQVEGFLTNFELRVFREISQRIPIHFSLNIDAFNQDYYQKQFGLALDFGHYDILLAQENFSIAHFAPTLKNPKNLEILEFQDRIAEVGGIFSQIDIWLSQGVLPEQICLVLPDENFVEYLKLFDKGRNFNFAMGVSLGTLEVFKHFKASLEAYFPFSDFETFIAALQAEFQKAGDDVLEVVQQALGEFGFALPYLKNLSVFEVALMALEYLKGKSVDDVCGGRISVMGILETRGVELDYVIVPEFNASCVPLLSDKDIFLNTKLKESVGLPTRQDRENLQKHYWSQLVHRAKAVRVLCLNNAIESPSRFLLEDSIFCAQKPKKTSLAYGEYFISGRALNYKEQQIIAPLEVDAFSATSLECFLSCKRKFYYQYILRLKAKDSGKINIGSKIHTALKDVYSQNVRTWDAEVLYAEFCALLSQSNSARESFESALAKKYLQKVFYIEAERFREGWIPLAFEHPFECVCEGFKLKGRMDRIDQNGDRILVLDYKYKKTLTIQSPKSYKDAKDFQLAIYALAAKEQYPNCNVEAAFYDLYAAEIKQEKDLANKIETLKEKLQEIKEGSREVDFSLTLKRNFCQYCDFVYLCNRF